MDPRDGLLRYVGMTVMSLEYRLEGHLHEKKSNQLKCDWIRELKEAGLQPQIISLGKHPVDELGKREIEMIAAQREAGANLLNIAPGGGARRLPSLKKAAAPEPLDFQESSDWEPPFEGNEDDRDLGDGYPPISQWTDDDRLRYEAEALNQIEGGTFWTAKILARQRDAILEGAQ